MQNAEPNRIQSKMNDEDKVFAAIDNVLNRIMDYH